MQTNPLRLRLTTSSILKMLTVVALVSGVFYAGVISYISANRDQALREKMALKFQTLGLPVPPELSLPNNAADTKHDRHGLDQIEAVIGPVDIDDDNGDVNDDEDDASFVASLDAQGRPVQHLSESSSMLPDSALPDDAAVQAANRNGSDLREIFTSNGVHLRLLTHRLPPGAPMAYLQVGKLLASEDRTKHRLLLILFAGSVLFTLVAGFFSWKITGRSLRATWQAWERQQTFVANASHELRTPLTLIRVSAQVMQQSLEPENPQRLLMDDVLSETDHMSKLVDDLLLLSRLDAGELKLDSQVIQLSEFLSRLQRQFLALAKEHGVSIRVVWSDGEVKADPTRLWQVLLILVDNALRHTPARGALTLSARVHNDVVKITVADSGDGIATEDLPHVFERFYKANNSLANKRSAGLGLAIAKPLIELHGGEIEIESQVGSGTRVSITLPAHRSPKIIKNAPALEPL